MLPLQDIWQARVYHGHFRFVCGSSGLGDKALGAEAISWGILYELEAI